MKILLLLLIGILLSTSFAQQDCLNITDNHCKDCDSTNTTFCGNCTDGYFKNQNTSMCTDTTIDSCIMGSLYTTLHCLSCSQNNHLACESCQDGFVLNSQNNTCHPPSQEVCSLQSVGCNNCTGTTYANFICTACNSSYNFNQTSKQCDIIQNTQTNITACMNITEYHCKDCNQNNSTKCLNCQDGYFLDSVTQFCTKTTIDSCIMGSLYTTLHCLSCSQNNHLACESCQDGFVLNSQNNTCHPPSQEVCSLQSVGCNNCTGTTYGNFICTACNSSYNFNQTSKSCSIIQTNLAPNTTCLNNTQNHCQTCLQSTNYSECDACQGGYQKSQGTNICNTTNAYSCTKVTPTLNCQSCDQTNYLMCSACKPGFVFIAENSTCALPTPAFCGAKQIGCINCTAPNKSTFNCTSCKTSYQYNTTTFICDLYIESCMYDDFKPQSCQRCNTTNYTKCGSCSTDRVLANNGSCVLGQLFCSQKFANCQICNGSSEQNYTCATCQSNFILNQGQCVQNTSNPQTTCLNNTQLNCASCNQANISLCQTCKEGTILTNVGACVIQSIVCTKKFPNCTSCNGTIESELVCNGCVSGFQLNQGFCQQQTIVECSVLNCTTCQPNSANNCSSCASGFFVNKEFQCSPRPICQEGQYTTLDQLTNYPICAACSKECVTCAKYNDSCTRCQKGQFLNASKCYNYDSNEFNSSNQNQKCNSNNSVWMPSPEIVITQSVGVCLPCPSGCSSCRINQNIKTCLTCFSSFSLNATSQLCDSAITCSSGQFSDFNISTNTTTCRTCNLTRCAECAGSANACTVCKQDQGRNISDTPLCRCNIGLKENSNLQCTSSCNSQQYFDSTESICKNCSLKYLNCNQCDNTKCLSCKYGYILSQDGMCQAFDSSNYNSQCLSNQTWYPKSFVNLTLGYCTACPTGCATCNYYGGEIKCKTCQANTTLNQTTGLCQAPTCPAGQYFNFLNSTCTPCGGQCSSCTQYVQGTYSQVQCNLCNAPYIISYQNYGKCQKNCTRAEYYNSTSDQCISCTQGTPNCNICYFYEKEAKQFYCKDCLKGYFMNYTTQTCEQAITCEINQVLNVQTKQCANCTGCTNCSLQIQNDYTSYQCFGNCQSGFEKDSVTKKCIKKQLSCNANQYADPKSNSCVNWNILNCAEFALNNSAQICKRCNENYYLNIDQTQCIQNPTCQANQFQFKNNSILECKNCQDFIKGCTNCSQVYGLKPICYNCANGDPINGICLTQENCTLTQYNANAFAGENALKKCVDCPKSCSSCKLDSANSTYPSCGGCNTGFVLQTQQDGTKMCTQSCSVGSFLNSKNQCQKCSVLNCRACSSESQCTECLAGFSLDSSKSCVQKVNTTCPKYAVLNNNGVCQCAKGYTMNANKICVKESSITCQKGKYLENSNCKPCVSLDSANSLVEGICTQCIDASTCQSCADGYYLKDSKCLQCSANCGKCKDDVTCYQCANNYKLWDGQCAQTCPVGTLPLVESLYRLNPQLFPTTTKSNLQTMEFNVQDSTDTPANCNPVAINLKGKSVCSSQKAQLPYTFQDNGAYTLNNDQFVMQCQPCKEKCKQCLPNYYLNINNNQCQQACKYPYKASVDDTNNQNICTLPQTASISLDLNSKQPQKIGTYFIQNLYKDAVLVAKVSNGKGSAFQWNLLDVYSAGEVTEKSKQVKESALPQSVSVEAKTKFLTQTQLNQSQLIISSANLMDKLIYKVNVSVTVNGNKYYQDFKFLVLPFVSEQLFNDLDISTEDWGTTSETGVATVDDFCAFYNFESSQIITNEKTWSFSISAFPDGIPLSKRWTSFFQSVDFQATYCFKAPYISADQSVIIEFVASSRGVKFTGQKMVTVYKSASFDMAQDSNYKKLQSSTNASLSDTAQLTSSLISQLNEKLNKTQEDTSTTQYSQVCSPTQTKAEQCSGHGSCIEYTKGVYRCNCDDGWKGHIKCAISTTQMDKFVEQASTIVQKAAEAIQNNDITPAQAQQGIETVKQAINIGNVKTDSVDNMQAIINKCSKKLNDVNSIQSLLNILDQISDILDVYDDQALGNTTVPKRRMLANNQLSQIDEKKKLQTQKNRENVNNMAANLAKTIDSDKPAIDMTSQKYRIQVTQVKSDQSTTGTVNIPGKAEITMPQSVIPKKGAVSVVNQDRNSLTANAKQSSVTLASNPIEVTIFDQEESEDDDQTNIKEKKVEKLTDKIRVKVDFDPSLKDNQKKCRFLNTTDGTLSSEGVEYEASTGTCVTSHLTLFVGASVPDTTPVPTGTDQNNNNQPNSKTVDSSLILPYLMMVFLSVLGYALII